MSFEQDGFLSEGFDKSIKDIRKRYNKQFELAHELNRIIQRLLSEINIPVEDGRLLIASTITSKQNNFYQSIIILCERGLFSSADVIVRSLIELYWILQCIVSDESFIEEYINTDYYDRLDTLKKVIKYPDAFRITEDVRLQYKNDLACLNKEIKDKGIKKLTKFDFAVKANDINGYITAYKILSSEVHTSVRSLERYFQISENKLESIIAGVEQSGAEKTIFTAIYYQLKSITALLSLFGEKRFESELKIFWDKYEELSNEYIKNAT